MTLREFWRYHFLKALLVFVALQVGIIAFIQNYNNKPVAVPDSAFVVEGRVLKINPILNDTDKDEDTELTIASFEQPKHGSIKQYGNILLYMPVQDYFGPDSFSYTVNDGKKVSEAARVSITVKENLPPTPVNDTIKVYAGKTVYINVLGNDKDSEEDSLFVADYTKSTKGKIYNTFAGFYYKASTVGSDSFAYEISDGKQRSVPALVFVEILPTINPLYPWLNKDIGNAAIAGKSIKNGNKLTLTGSGSDIWQEEDGFQFVYQLVEGDCEMSAKIESLEATHEWSKTGIMVRENLTGGSKHSMLVMANRNGACTHQRMAANESASGTDPLREVTFPYWIKLKRKGDNFIFSISEDGKTWNEIEELENPMSEKVYIGLVCSSHDNNELATVEYSNIKLKATEVKMYSE